MLLPASQISDTVQAYLPKMRRRVWWIYGSLLVAVLGALFALPFVYTNISVKTMGITRPALERTEVKSVIGGIIDTIFYKEGSHVEKGKILLRLKDPVTPAKKQLNQQETQQRQAFAHDLTLLTTADPATVQYETLEKQLQTPLYKEQLSRFVYRRDEQDIQLQKATKEVELHTRLAKEKIISPKEFFDIQNREQQLQSTKKAFLREQQTLWQQDLARYKMELSQFYQQSAQIHTDARYYEVIAPVSGIVQGINTRYAGGLLAANELLCTISPEGDLIGECFVTSKDVGLLKPGQPGRYQFDAFDYNHFGSLTGKIISIDNDFSVINNTPVIKVRCSFDSTTLPLKNGYTGELQKGLNFQARFLVAKRSLWQLLYDTLDDWLNPAAPAKTAQNKTEK